MEDLQFAIEPLCDMRYARTGIELKWVHGFQPVLDTVLQWGMVVTRPKDMIGPEVCYRYGEFYIYRYWQNRWAKELSFGRPMMLGG